MSQVKLLGRSPMRGIYLNITKQFKLEIIRKSSNNIDKINTSAQALG